MLGLGLGLGLDMCGIVNITDGSGGEAAIYCLLLGRASPK